MKIERVSPVQKISELNFTPPVKKKRQTSKVSKSFNRNPYSKYVRYLMKYM